MILKSIRLHPFGNTADRTYPMSGPVVVVLGPNEFGKSTLRQAIHHALFTTTQQTPKQAEKSVGRWFPRPDGDHAVVTVVFEAGGVEWTLVKRWGAGHRSELMGAGTVIGGEAAVQQRIGEMLGHNEATARLVLSTGQAELASTLFAIKNAKADELRPVGDVMTAAAGVAGDIGPEKLRARLTSVIKAHFSRWNRQRQAPELDNGMERGIRKPWVNDVGTILAAWYHWQRRMEELEAVRRAERALDAVTAELATLQTQMAEDSDFIRSGRLLRDGLNDRLLVVATLAPWRAESAAMAEASRGWPSALTAIGTADVRIEEIKASIAALEAEEDAARRRDAARQTQDHVDLIVAARRASLAAEDAVRCTARPADADVAELGRVSERIKDTGNRLDARKLAYTVVSTEPMSAVVEEGNEAERVVPIGPAGGSGNARSRLRLQAGPVTLTVTSGEEDVDVLLDTLRRDEQRAADLLRACDAATLADAQVKVKQHDALVQSAARAKDLLETRLQGKTFEAWQEAVAAIAMLPQTRGTDAIAAELKAAREKLVNETSTRALHDGHVREWIATYKDQESLLDALVAKRSAIRRSEERLAELPAVPEGFQTPQAFFAELGRRETANAGRPERAIELATQQQQLRDDVGDRRTVEIEEEAGLAKRAFERACQEGRDYERILEVLEEIIDEGEADPTAVFAAKVASYFRAITGGDDDLAFDAQTPHAVRRGAAAIPAGFLSQGGTTALALVMRLALAEAHLGGSPGFIVLDDPFVDLDADRRSRAVGLVRQFAERHQVVFLTCHESHAQDVGRPGPPRA